MNLILNFLNKFWYTQHIYLIQQIPISEKDSWRSEILKELHIVHTLVPMISIIPLVNFTKNY